MTKIESLFEKNLLVPRATLQKAAVTMDEAEAQTAGWTGEREIIQQSIKPEMLHWLKKMNQLSTWGGLTHFQLWIDRFRVRRLFQKVKPVIFVTYLRITGLCLLIATAYLWSKRKIIFKLSIAFGAYLLLCYTIEYVVKNYGTIQHTILQLLGQ